MQGPRRSFWRINRCLRRTLFNVSVRDLSVFVREKVGYTGSKGQSRRSFLHENLHKIYRRGESVTEGKFGNCIVLLSIGATIEGVDQIEIRSLTSI